MVLWRQPVEIGRQLALELSKSVPEAVKYSQSHQNFVQSLFHFHLKGNIQDHVN